MNYRLATVLARKTISGDTVEPIDIKLIDPVSQIQIVYESTCGGPAPINGLATACITKIELIDGSDVLFNLSGYETQALDFYHSGIEPANINNYREGGHVAMIFNINFGRFLWDPTLAFDPKKFKNPQLKISIDVDAGGKSSSGGYLTVLANIFDEKAVSPVGFLMQKEVKNYALGTDSHEYTQLPTDYPYRKLLIRSLIRGCGAEDTWSNIKLSEDNDRKIPFNHSIGDILRGIVTRGKPYRETAMQVMGLTTGTFFCTPTHNVVVTEVGWEVECQQAYHTVMGGSGGRGTIYANIPMTGVNFAFEGYVPHGVLEFPFGLQDDPGDWYDVSKVGSLELDILSEGARTENCQIFLQQLRTY